MKMFGGKDSSDIRNATVIAIGVVTLLAVLASYVFYQQNLEIVSARNWVNHTYEVKGHIQELQNRLRDAAGGERSYLFTGDEAFLVNYNEALRPSSSADDSLAQHHSIQEEIDILRRETADNPAQQENLDNIQRGAEEFLGVLASTIRQRKAQGFYPAEGNAVHQNKEYMDRMRGMLGRMTEEENHLLELRTQVDANGIRASNSLVFICIGIFYVLLVLSILIYQHARQSAQRALLAYAAQLKQNAEERRVSHEQTKLYLDLRAQSEQILRLNEDLSRSNEELERFAYICSHDMQEPARMMSCYAELVAEQYRQTIDGKGQKYLTFIVDNARHMQKMIVDILDFSRAGREQLQIEPVDSGRILRDVLKEFEAPIADKKARVICDEMPTVNCSATMLHVLFQNLIGNALKFQNGSQTPEITITATPTDNEWRFSVRDNGIGIDPAFGDRVFAIFQRIHRREEYPGKKLVQLYGGKIWFDSAPDQGTTFTFTIPYPSAIASEVPASRKNKEQ
jgi:signal transduction histidine kinase